MRPNNNSTLLKGSRSRCKSSTLGFTRLRDSYETKVDSGANVQTRIPPTIGERTVEPVHGAEEGERAEQQTEHRPAREEERRGTVLRDPPLDLDTEMGQKVRKDRTRGKPRALFRKERESLGAKMSAIARTSETKVGGRKVHGRYGLSGPPNISPMPQQTRRSFMNCEYDVLG